MQHLLRSVFIIVILVVLGITSTQAQIFRDNSPYSYYGIGNQQPITQSLNRSMGGVSMGYRSPTNLNTNNPASYTSGRFTILETAFFVDGRSLANADTTQSTATTSLAYLNFLFPVHKKHWGMSMGIMPFSSVSYDVLEERTNEQGLQQGFQYLGEGDIYQVYWGNGFRYKNLSVGFNLSYLFGTTRKSVISSIIDTSFVDWGNRFIQKTSVGDFMWRGGIQYNVKVGKKTFLNLGMAGNVKTNIKSERERLAQRFQLSSSGNIIIRDTTTNVTIEEGEIVLPQSFTFGFLLEQPFNWSVGADISFTNGESFRNFGLKDSLVNSYKIALGASLTPSLRTLAKYHQKVDYRLGFYYDTGHLNVKNTKISTIGLSFGFGLPLRAIPKTNLYSRLNLSFELGQTGTISDGLIRESFFKTTIGLNLNDIWFIKRKFD